MDPLMALVLLAVLLAAPCFVQLVLWGAYQVIRAAAGLAPCPVRLTAP
jgi:hypothetical protein